MDFGSLRDRYGGRKAQEAAEEEGAQVELQLRLPNGEVKAHAFKTGHTIAYVKLQIQVRRRHWPRHRDQAARRRARW
jgi:hypothetical protein